jgi:hypothetical protein
MVIQNEDTDCKNPKYLMGSERERERERERNWNLKNFIIRFSNW